LHEGMKALLDRATPDESAVMKQADAIGVAETELYKQHLDTMLEIRALLTPEQREKLSAARGDAIEGSGCAKHGAHAGCPMHQGGDCPMQRGADCPMHRGGDCPMHEGAGCPMHRGADCPMQRESGGSEPPESDDAH